MNERTKKRIIIILTKTLFFAFFFLWEALIGCTDFFDGEGIHAVESNAGLTLKNDASENPEFAEFEKRLTYFMKHQHIKGASIAMVKDGKLVYAKGLGYADKEKEIETQPYHHFRVASMSKLITATAVMQLQEKQILSLDDKVFGEDGILNDSVYLNFRDTKVQDITIRHLLNHTGGWSVRGGDPLFMPHIVARIMKEPIPIDDKVLTRFMLEKRRLTWKPGTRSAYSNFGYVVLGMIIEKKTGMPYENYVQQNILNPLGINDMYIGSGCPEQSNHLEVNYYAPENELLIRPFYDTIDTLVEKACGGNDIRLLGAAGGWVASSVSMMKLLTAIDGFQERPDILSPVSVHQMTANLDKKGPLGWRGVNQDNWWRTGSFSGTSALMVRQQNNISWIVLFNSSNWRGPRLAQMLYNQVKPAIDRIDHWPDQDLFIFASPHYTTHLQ